MSVALASGETFAGYRIEAVVGRGGMGVVYRATDLRLERPVALKLVAPELAEDEVFRRRFLREPKLAAALDHPNVVPIYEAGEHEGRLYLAMRFVDGSDLRTLLRGEGVPVERALAILAQVASALDAAHRRDLVHRDVKPANVLVDEDGHTYLTDFGVTKQLGGDSTDTGQIVGTLDYLAPEQIRGERVDGQADEYALGCVLFECLSGAPPFHRATEAETLWAHMQEAVPPVPGRPALDPVLRRALAKEPGDRYGSSAELIEAARLALAGVRVPVRLVRRRWAIVAAGVLALAAVAAIALTRGGDSPPAPAPAPPAGNGLARIASGGDDIASFTRAVTPPSNIAVGEGGVWMLNTEDETVSRVDPRTGEVIRTYEPRGHPTDIAAGAGALWIGTGPGHTTRVSRVDPGTARVTRTVRLPGADGQTSEGFPMIAVGAGAVWAINPDGNVSRLDARSGRRVAAIPSPPGGTRTIAAGDAGVWMGGWDNMLTPIDPRTNRTGEPIELGSNRLFGIAVGAGSVWATSEEGVLWRVDPPVERTIELGAGVQHVAFGDGGAWAANWNDGTVSRVDSRTNAVTARVAVGAAQALAAGAGSAWISVAGGSRNGVLPASACGEVVAGGRTPDVLVATDMPLREDSSGPRAIADAVRFVIRDHGFRAGRYAVGYHSCDDSTAQAGTTEFRKCAANANAFATAKRLVALIGPYYSFCAQYEIPILNRAPGGPLALLGPTTTHPNLTRGGPLALPPPFGYRGEPDVYYPTGERNFFRVAGRGDLAGVALARLAKSLKLRSVYLLNDNSIGDVLFTDGFARAAPALGVDVAGVRPYQGRSLAATAAAVARSGADGAVLSGALDFGGGPLLKALRARLGSGVTLMTGDGFLPVERVRREAGEAADGLYLAFPSLLPAAGDLTPAARRFVRGFGAAADEDGVLAAAQATETVLAAIARSDGARASVLRELRATRNTGGILGPFSFDRYGDLTPAPFTILRVTDEVPAGGQPIEGAVVDRVIEVPTS